MSAALLVEHVPRLLAQGLTVEEILKSVEHRLLLKGTERTPQHNKSLVMARGVVENIVEMIHAFTVVMLFHYHFSLFYSSWPIIEAKVIAMLIPICGLWDLLRERC